MDNKINDTEQKQDMSIVEIEKIVLSHALSVGNKDVDEIFLQLQPEDFVDMKNRTIYITICKLRNEGYSPDFMTLITYFNDNPEVQFNNYKIYINEVYNLFSYQTNLIQLIDIIKNHSIQRKMKDFAKMLNETNLDVLSSKEKLWNLEKDFLNITSNKKSKEIESLRTIIVDYQKKLSTLLSSKNSAITGTPTGQFRGIDEMFGGFQPGDMIILAARPGIGKTALSINFLVGAAEMMKIENEERVSKGLKPKTALMFSMEMGKDQVLQRILSAKSSVAGERIKRGNLEPIQHSAIEDALTSLYDLPLYIDDSSQLSIMDLQSKIKQLSSDKEIGLIVIDYLQLLTVPSRNSGMNRHQEVGLISRTIKSIARQYNVPIIAIAQLSRKVEERKSEGKKPMLSDLRESGSIEQDADIVIFLNYDDASVKQNETTNKHDTIDVEFIVSKNRNGSIGTIRLVFEKNYSRYREIHK